MLILHGFMFLFSLILVNPLKTMPTLAFDVLKIQPAEDAAFWTVIPAISGDKATEPENALCLILC